MPKKHIEKINLSIRNSSGSGKSTGKVIQNGSTANILIDIPKAKPPAAAAATGVTTAVVTETISYEINDDISTYTLDMSGTEITIDKVLGSNGDMRDHIPWFDVDEEIPVISITVAEVTTWYFLAPLIYIGTEDFASLRWLETPWRAAAVYK
jgi:hypothetical protein